MYILKADYKSRISTALLDMVIAEGANNGQDILEDASKVAEDTIASYAGVFYDILPEFQKAGNNRNHLVKTWALNIATYEVYQRIDDEEVPEKVIKNYDDTIEDLQKLANGKFPLALPPKTAGSGSGGTGSGGDEGVETDGVGLLRFGSQKKRSHLP